MNEEEQVKIPYKLFAAVVTVVAVITFLIMNYNPVPITFIFFTIKVPLTLLFFILMVFGALVATLYWRNKYKKLKAKYERSKKLLFTKEQLEAEKTKNEELIDELEI